MRFTWKGREVKRKGGSTKEEAKRRRRNTITDLERGEIQLKPTAKDTLAGALERYRPIAQRNRNYKKTQCFFTFWEQHYGAMGVRSITPTLIEQAQQRLIDAKKSPATVNRYTDWLRHVLNREVRLGHLQANPFARVSRLREPEAPIYQYTPAQEMALIEALGVQGDWVRLSILSRLRRQEQFSMRKEYIDWQHGYIQIPTSKAGRPKIVPLTKEIRSIMERLCAQHPDSPWVFPSQRWPEKHMNPGSWYTKVFKKVRDELGIPKTMVWHTFGHTGGSRLAAMGANAHQIKAWGGWRTDHAANRYIHLISKDVLEVAERLSESQSDSQNSLKAVD